MGANQIRARSDKTPMSTVVLISFVLPVFFTRDWLLLRMGPAATTMTRLRGYALVLLASTILFSAVTFSVRTERLLEILLSPSVTLPVVLLYGALLAVSIWIKRTDRHQVAWQIALSPNPILVLTHRDTRSVHSSVGIRAWNSSSSPPY